MSKAEKIAIYRNAYNAGKLTLKEFEAFMHCIDAEYAETEMAKQHALAHLRFG